MVTVSYPGVYIEEVPSGVNTITGVSTSIAAFFGRTTKGPMNKAVRILSLSDFARAFGASHPDSDLGRSVRMFFENGGTDCYVVRLASGAAKADVTLHNLVPNPVLVATAKNEGAFGNNMRLEVDYDTAAPNDTFNLSIIQEDAGVEVQREDLLGLSMNPNAARYAPDFVTQSSSLIDLALASDAGSGGANDIFGGTSGIEGFSQSRVYSTTPIAPFRTEIEALLVAGTGFEINVDDTHYVRVDTGAIGPALNGIGAWQPSDLATQLQTAINNAVGPALPAHAVAVDVVSAADGANNFVAFRLRSDPPSGDNGVSVRVRRSSSNDVANDLMLGLDQGGIEPTRYSGYRPAPTAAYFTPVDDIIDLAILERDDIASIAVDGEPAIGFGAEIAALTPAATDRWFLSSAGTAAGVTEKLGVIAQAVNDDATSSWRAEVWGYHLALLAKGGTSNETAASVVSATDTSLGGADFSLNVRRYSLGTTGTGSFQTAGAPGTDGGAPGLNDYLGSEAAQTGFHALDPVDLFNLMVLPADSGAGAAAQTDLWGPASTYCAAHRAFLLVDAPPDWTDGDGRPVATATEVNTLRAPIVNDYAAVFYPRALYNDAGVVKAIGPSGAIAGLMSRIDSTRGVWKAPAGIEASLRGVVGLEVKLTDPENGVLNKLGVNCLRIFPNGFVNWGARTLDGADDFGSEWKYVPIRRLALFLEESLFRGTKWVVFEPNDEPLWAKIRMNLNAFMLGLFRQGAFQGSTPDQAFFVKCDAETTTQNDRNLGIVNIEVGFAPLKPAEFVVIRIQQIAGDLG